MNDNKKLIIKTGKEKMESKNYGKSVYWNDNHNKKGV